MIVGPSQSNLVDDNLSYKVAQSVLLMTLYPMVYNTSVILLHKTSYIVRHAAPNGPETSIP